MESIPKMELLPDPKNNRMVKDVKPPPHRPLRHDFLYRTGSYLGNSNREQ